WHWFQYIGLNYILVKYKYAPDSPHLQSLPRIPVWPLFFATCTLWMLTWLAIGTTQLSLPANSLTMSILAGTIIGFANCHYFLDAFLWRFREQYQREAVLPYILAPRKASLNS